MVQAYNSAGFTTNETDLDLDLKPQPNVSLEERTRALLPLHLALQTLLEMNRYLILPDHSLNTLTRSVIAKYSAGPITDITKVFYEKAVSLIHVQQGLIEKLPDLWTHETSYSSGGSLVAQAFVHLTREPRLRFLEDKADFEAVINEPDQKSSEKAASFLCTRGKIQMDVSHAELVNEFEYQYYGFSPVGFTDSVYNIAVQSWQEAVKEVLATSLPQVANDKRFLSAVMAMIFRRKEVKKAFEVFTDRALKYVFRIPRCVTLPEHQETHELIHTMDSNTMSVDELNRNCERLAAEVVEKRFTLLDLEQQLQEANDVIEVLSIVIKQLRQVSVGEDCNDGSSSNTTLGGTDTN
uniref:Protein MIS-12, isoform b n=1 Tax=Haemonchus contortus TaxID=6289 RepID=W6NDU2_HAECO